MDKQPGRPVRGDLLRCHQSVRWYPRFKFGFSDLVEMMAGHSLSLACTTIMRWLHHCAAYMSRRCSIEYRRRIASAGGLRRSIARAHRRAGAVTGLGLSMSYDIVTQQHGGSITLDSEVGVYSEFTVRLPRNP
jgi:hypothetical protein